MICCTRCMWLAKQATTMRLPVCEAKTRRSVTPTLDSDSVKPGSSALVESESRRRMPSVRASSPMRDRSVRRPSTGWRSSLKSPECRITPCGVWKAMAIASGTEWVTGMNSTPTPPTSTRLAVADRHEAGAVGQAGLLDPVPGQPDRQLGAVDRRLQLAQQVGQAPGVVLVPVGQDDPVDPIPAVVQVGELGQHQVDAGHVGVGEHDAAVEDDDPAVDLDAGAVATDLSQTAEEDDADGFGFLRSAKRRHRDHRLAQGGQDLRRLGVQLGRGLAHRKPALADAQAQRPHGGLGRQGVGVLGARLEVERIEQFGVAGQRCGEVAGQEGVDARPGTAVPPSGRPR